MGANSGRENELVSMYGGLTDEFLARIGRVRHFIRHPFLEGAAHEAILRDFLRTYLPEPYGVSRGAVWNPETRESTGECDILMYNRTFPVIFRETDFVVVRPSAAVALVEVRTALPEDRRDWENIIKKIRRIHQTTMTDGKRDLAVFLFVFMVHKPLETRSTWQIDPEFDPIEGKDFPDVVCILGDSVLVGPDLFSPTSAKGNEVRLVSFRFDERKGSHALAPEPFMLFFALLMQEIEKKSPHGQLQLGPATKTYLDALQGRDHIIHSVLFRIGEKSAQ